MYAKPKVKTIVMKDSVPVVTIDGPGGSGKGTVTSLLASELGWHLLDSGALYRLTALAALNRGIALDDEAAVAKLAANLDVQFIAGTGILLDGEHVELAIRQEAIGLGASRIAAFPAVRAALLARQQAFAVLPGLVADGRDMGTVVFPDAPVKIFLIASAEERAKRRFLQLQGQGVNVSLERLLEDIVRRDEQDANRAVAPMIPADDAIVLDSTQLTIQEVLARVVDEMHAKGVM